MPSIISEGDPGVHWKDAEVSPLAECFKCLNGKLRMLDRCHTPTSGTYIGDPWIYRYEMSSMLDRRRRD